MLLPAWTGLLGLPNPPTAQTVSGRLITGDRIIRPAKIVDLGDNRLEPNFGQFRPDIAARDEQGELLIEVRVTHAVDDAKAVLVRQGRHRMIEIDLSQISPELLFDPEGFKNHVLSSETNRTWISNPAAESAWELARDQVKALTAEESTNDRIPRGSSSPAERQSDSGTRRPLTAIDSREVLPLSQAESEDQRLYPRIGTITKQARFGYGVVLSRATRSRAVYWVRFGHSTRLIFFKDDEPKR